MPWTETWRDPADTAALSPPLWVRVLEVLALAKLGLALVGLANVGTVVTAYQATFFTIHILVYGAAGLLLRYLGRQDQRAVSLGLCFLFLATVWADRLLFALAELSTPLTAVALTLRETAVVAFVPYFLWLFVLEFPRPRLRTDARAAELAAGATLVLGGALFLANLALLLPAAGGWAVLLRFLDRGRFDGAFWPAVILSAVMVVPYAASQMTRAEGDEKRRVQIVLASLFLGLAPQLLLTLLLSVWPRLLTYQQSATGELVTDMIVYPGELLMPFMIMYAVLVHRALDVRLLVRQVLEYALARHTLSALIAMPFALLVYLVYTRQDQPIGALLSGTYGMVVVSLLAGGVLLSTMRPRLVVALDRRFFREQYDARRILSGLATITRGANGGGQLASMLAEQVDAALHLHSARVLFLDAAAGCFSSPTEVPAALPANSIIVRRLRQTGEAMEIDWSRRGGLPTQLPEPEQRWLLDADVRLLVPIPDENDELLGVLLLGEKRSGLPFTAEDRLLLGAMTSSIAPAVRRSAPDGAKAGSSRAAESDAPARECLNCQLVAEAGVRRCPRCDHATVKVGVPRVLTGKFRLLQRLGQGGMGIVYRAEDIDLDRPVAIKTLPSVASQSAAQLKREARAMAAVAHPHLAVIYGSESWRGVPMLVIEFLPGGTLADRLSRGRLSCMEALRLGEALTGALAALHGASLIHGDVKPSNIGFSEFGTPKLLDFGLSRVLLGTSYGTERASWQSHRTLARASSAGGAGYARNSALVGTPLYFSPEQVRGRKPDATTDLWALAMVLYETVAGIHPLSGCTLDDVFRRLAEEAIPDMRLSRPDAPEPVAELLRWMLHPDLRRRPRSASEMLDAIVDTQRSLHGAGTEAGVVVAG